MRRPRVSSQARHSGGVGAPPGPKMRPCQELADDRKVYPNATRTPPLEAKNGKRGTYGESAARPSVKSPRLARREAPAVVRKDRGTIGLRFSARHPPSCLALTGGEKFCAALIFVMPAKAGIQ